MLLVAVPTKLPDSITIFFLQLWILPVLKRHKASTFKLSYNSVANGPAMLVAVFN